ncbi:MAG: helix-turn-helix domain-containing protein, partial [Acidobacteriota bacterium]
MENPPVQEIHVIRDLAQLKALADPLRVRILEAFAEQPRTTKQVAARIEEKPTKLYHHVDALHKAGLIVLETTRQNRGTVEKYFRAIARLFRTDPELFGGAGGDGEAGLHAAVAES